MATDEEIKASIETNESRAHWGAIAVVAGLIIEVILATGISLGIDRRGLENWESVFADSLVALGVLSEVYFGRMASRHHAELQQRSEEKIAEANARAAEANKEARAAQLQLEQIKRRVGARKITDEAAFLETLSSAEPPRVINIFQSEAAIDGDDLGFQLYCLFEKAGWNVLWPTILRRDDWRVNPGVVTLDETRSQVVVLAGPLDDAPPAKQQVENAISAALGNTSNYFEKRVPPDEIWVIILPKL